ncbi:DUF2339 domain-containing protein [Qipengyuania sp. RANM35]|uniref:DUF2339 domain-containing protein n=1 Tax=Qipengyuania sp. RANM35 TaxID=3068635 RepID=UPI0034DB2FCC
MEWLFIFGLAGLVARLWHRLDRAEQKLERLDELQDHMFDAMRTMRPAEREAPVPVEETAPPAPRETVTVPKVRLSQTAHSAPPSETPEPAGEPQVTAPAAVDHTEEPHPPKPLRERFAFDLEDVFGRRLPIWAGGVTLAVAGVFLVRYSIERGLITPLLRVIMAFVFGGGLIAGAEAAYRFREKVADPRVAQALAGAGLATLYAGFYLAGTQYGLIGQTMAFLGLAAVTAGAIALSFRFGLPSAVLGLVGGFAAPAVVGGDNANLPLLALYLGLVTGGLTYAGREQKREWMGIAAMVGGLGWGALLLLGGEPGFADVLALGLYFVVLGAVLPALSGTSRFELPFRLASALVASVQLALLVDSGGYSPLAWGLYLLLGATLGFFGWRRPDMREANAIAATVGLLLLGQWTGASGEGFAIVASGIAAIFAGLPLLHIWREDERKIDLWQVGGLTAALAIIAYASFGDFVADRIEAALAAGTLALATFPALAAWRLWHRGPAPMLAFELLVALMLVFAASLMVTPAWLAPIVAAALFAGSFALLREREEKELFGLLWGIGTASIFSLLGHVAVEAEVMRLSAGTEPALGLRSLLRWLAPLAVMAALAWRERMPELRHFAEGAAAALAYAALAQVLPGWTLAWAAALLAIALSFGLPDRPVARLVAVAIAASWALLPLLNWVGAALMSLGGEPVFVDAIPSLAMIGRRLLPLIAALAFLRLPPHVWRSVNFRLEWLALIPLAVALHVAFKQVFAIETITAFVSQGLAERTLWQALLLAAGWAAMTRVPLVGRVIMTAALVHFLVYTGLLHNPLWDRQAVGATPVANLVLAAYAVAVGTALMLRRAIPERLKPAADGLVVALVSLGTLTLLRQAFAGSIPVDAPMTQTEDLLRSLLGIVLAIGFLILGSRRGERSWRVGSLVLMVLAVAKVFIVDAAGLEGLLRIASFMALGFSLIGIGWLYSRQLRGAPIPQ